MEKLIRIPPQTESSKPQADSNAHTESDSLIEYMKERGIPITFRNYLGILYLNPNHELTPEQGADLPPELWEGEQDENQ